MTDIQTLQEHWDHEARTDPRYTAGKWGMNGFEDAEETITAILDILTNFIPEQKSSADSRTVLEFGCGPIRLLSRLAKLYPTIDFVGVDISPAMIQRAAHFRDRDHLVNVALWNGGMVDWADESISDFDLIYAVEVIQHLTDEQVVDFAHDAQMALKPGGRLIMQFVDNGRAQEPYSYPRTLARLDQCVNRATPNSWLSAWDIGVGIHPEWHWVAYAKAQ